MSGESGYDWLEQLLEDPEGFSDRGDGYRLLQACFAGFPVEKLAVLANHPSPFVQRTVAFVLSELGSRSVPHLESALSLLRSSDVHTRAYAAEVVQVSAVGEQVRHYPQLISLLDDEHAGVRWRAAELLVLADESQLRSAQTTLGPPHSEGLSWVLGGPVSTEATQRRFHAKSATLRRYATIAARRSRDPFALELARTVGEPELRDFREDSEPTTGRS